MTNLLYSKFRESIRSSLRWILLIILFLTAFLVFSLLAYFDVITVFENVNKNASLQLVISLLLEAVSIIGALVILMQYFLDYKLIQSETYTMISAEVSRFDFYWSGYEPMERIWFPVFVDVSSGKTIKIEIDEKVEVGDRYNIVFLPRTKIIALKKANN
jgi:hypothetical protein